MRPVAAESPTIYWGSRLLLGLLLIPLGLMLLRSPRGRDGSAVHYAAWAALAPIGIPVAWMHYQQLLLLPLLVLAVAWLRGEPPSRVSWLGWATYAVALVLITFGDHYTVLGAEAGELWKTQVSRVDAANDVLLARFAGPAMLLVSYKLYGALLLWALCVVEAWRSSAWKLAVYTRLADARSRRVGDQPTPIRGR
jgi:hypothetical protein